MNAKEELLQQLEESTNALSDVLSAFTEAAFEERPLHDKWSAAEIAEHLLLLENIVVKSLSGFCIATQRDPFAKRKDIERHMGNYDRAFSAPQFILPLGKMKQQDAIDQLLAARKMTTNLVMITDITETCMDSEHPGFGQLTRGEWVFFDICHANRHLQQLRHIEDRSNANRR